MDPGMGLTSLHIGPQPTSLNSLDHDILVLIVEQLYLDLINDVPRGTWSDHILGPLGQLQKVSARLYMATRSLRNRKMANVVISKSSPFWNHVTKHTRHFVFSCSIDWKAAAGVLAACERVESIEWSWWDCEMSPLPIPKVISDVIRTKWPHAELHIVGFPLDRDVRHIIPSIPSMSVASISIRSPPASIRYAAGTSYTHPDLELFRCLAAASPNLQSLECTGLKILFSSTGPRLPPIKHLKLVKCWWKYLEENVDKTWDFSLLESLELDEVVSALFLSSLRQDDLPCLKALKMKWYPDRHTQVVNPYLTPKLCRFLSQATGMRSIDVVCEFLHFEIDELMDGWQELKVLKIHDFVGFGPGVDSTPGSFMCPTILATSLSKLRICCPHLRELSLDMDTRTCDKRNFFRSIAQFKNLTKLNIHTQTTLLEFGDNGNGDPDLEATRQLVDTLTSHKDGLRMEVITFHIGGFGLRPGLRWTDGWVAQERKGHSRERQYTFSWNSEGRRRVFIQTPWGVTWRMENVGAGSAGNDLIARVSVSVHSGGTCDVGVGPW